MPVGRRDPDVVQGIPRVQGKPSYHPHPAVERRGETVTLLKWRRQGRRRPIDPVTGIPHVVSIGYPSDDPQFVVENHGGMVACSVHKISSGFSVTSLRGLPPRVLV